jgi:hypothetical protein
MVFGHMLDDDSISDSDVESECRVEGAHDLNLQIVFRYRKRRAEESRTYRHVNAYCPAIGPIPYLCW